MAERQQRAERAQAERYTSATGATPEGAARETTAEDPSATRHMKQDAKAAARELGREAEERADRWTTSVGRRAESLARALRVARDSLWTEGEEQMASVVGQAADHVDRMSGYLEDENPSAMLEDMAELGRRNPGAFLGSAFTLGLATGRFLRASSPDGDDAPVSGQTMEARR
jgi:hypothetical protein